MGDEVRSSIASSQFVTVSGAGATRVALDDVGTGFAIDNLSITVPEPRIWSLTLGALIACCRARPPGVNRLAGQPPAELELV